MKRILVILLCLLLVACSAAKNETASDGAEAAASESNTQPAPPDGNPPSDGNPPPAPPEGAPGEPPQGAPGEPPQGGPGGPGGSAESVSYTAATEITAADTRDGETYESTAADENALLIATNEAVEIRSATVKKTGDSNGGDACNFYGLNAAVLAKDGASVSIVGGTIETSADGANGVFCYGGNGGRNGAEGDGTTVTLSGVTITTTGNGSGGIMTTGGGTTYASDLSVTTSGRSSAPIRTDRGGGTVVVNGGTFTSNGLGSPAIYSTADITAKDAVLVSNLSEGVVIEGKNAVRLENCTLTANNTQRNSNASFLDTIMLYQSMSGDADTGTAQFAMTGGSLVSKSGHVFHVTNTNAVIELASVSITNEDPANVLLSVCADGWSGAKNVAALQAKNQVLAGTILVGSDSELTLTLSEGSSFTGAISGEIVNAKGETVSSEVGTVHVAIDGTSTWTLTADTYLTSFTGDVSSVVTGGFALYVNGERIA
ncbi:MAG: hypothetical protein IJJ86_00415 [Clostridia bacterium]|nr:hypothetical protein [Clostridia bacterium]